MPLLNLHHLVGATKYSLAGIKHAWAKEQAFKHEVCMFIPIAFLLFCIRPGVVWSSVLICSWLAVMVLELVNSTLEIIFNLLSPDYNIHVKYGKDMASASVFIMLVINAILWLAMIVTVT